MNPQVFHPPILVLYLGTTVAAWLLLASTSAPTLAQSDAEPRPYYTQALGPLGIYRAGLWGAVKVDVANPSAHPVELMTSTYFVIEPSRQFGRELWVPANSRRSSWFPLQVPAEIPKNQERLEARSLLFDRSEQSDIALRGPDGAYAVIGALPIERRRPVTALIVDEQDSEASRTALAMRRSQNLSDRVHFLNAKSLPPLAQYYEGFDQIIFSSKSLPGPIELAALRSWVHGGGRLWMMLDLVDPATAALLFGDVVDLQIIDRVDLTECQITAAAKQTQPSGQPRNFPHRPVAFLRLLTDSVQVKYVVGDWPAAFWQSVGTGEVLFTTVGSRAWLDAVPSSGSEAAGAAISGLEEAGEPLITLANRFLQQRAPPALPPRAMREFVRGHVGYRILDRSTVALWLVGYCLLTLAAGIIFAISGRPERVAFVSALAAAGIAVPLLLLGHLSRVELPEEIAIGQFVQAFPQAEQLLVDGHLAVHSAASLTDPFAVIDGASLELEAPEQSVPMHRWVWSDLDSYHSENLRLRTGLHFAKFSNSMHLSQPITAWSTFTSEGLAGTLQSASWVELEDALIAFPSGAKLAVQFGPNGRFTASPDAALSPEQFVADAVVSDEQRARAQVVAQLLAEQSGFPDVATLLAWAPPKPGPFDLPEDLPIKGGALFAVPIALDRPEPETAMVIPAAFLPYESVASRAGATASTAYDNARQKWIGPLTQGSQIALRFQVPREVLPARLDSAELHFKIHAPGRSLAISAGEELIKRFSGPTGRLRCQVNDAQKLQLDDQGRLLLILTVGNRSDEQLAEAAEVGWQIDELSLSVSGIANASPSNTN